MNWEFQILYGLQQIHNQFLDPIMVGISTTGNSGLIWIVLALMLLCWPKTRRAGFAMLITMLLGALVGNLFLKNMVARPRPCWVDESITLLIPNPKDFSFPSGHTLAAFAASTSLFFYHKKWGCVALCYAALMAFSRLYLFVHYPTDVVAGMLLGIFLAIFVKKSFQIRRTVV